MQAVKRQGLVDDPPAVVRVDVQGGKQLALAVVQLEDLVACPARTVDGCNRWSKLFLGDGPLSDSLGKSPDSSVVTDAFLDLRPTLDVERGNACKSSAPNV